MILLKVLLTFVIASLVRAMSNESIESFEEMVREYDLKKKIEDEKVKAAARERNCLRKR